ncbi:hypothetical protein YC2023_078161 [Brassica napus]
MPRISTSSQLLFSTQLEICLKPSSIYKIVIAINTPTTMNNQFEDLNAPQIDLHSFFSILMN